MRTAKFKDAWVGGRCIVQNEGCGLHNLDLRFLFSFATEKRQNFSRYCISESLRFHAPVGEQLENERESFSSIDVTFFGSLFRPS